MRVFDQHERLIDATPERVAELVSDFNLIWPTDIAPAPRPVGQRRFAVPPMLWEEVERGGATRAFRVVSPAELDAEHWFELDTAEDGTVLRHIVEGQAIGDFEAVWCDRIAPLHSRLVEGLLDKTEAAAARDV